MIIETTTPKIKTFFESAKYSIKTNSLRQEKSEEIAQTIAQNYLKYDEVNINFICTHNSRRSQMAQAWAFFASDYFNLDKIFSFSGGTDVTSFHRNTVKTLQKSGFKFNVIDFSHQNPRYLISFEGTEKSILGFSKNYDNEENKSPFIAITTCDKADVKCPKLDTEKRFHFPFSDPKEYDKTSYKTENYDKTNQEIAGEIFILFQKTQELINQ